MTELVGDICIPSELYVPILNTSTKDTISGILFISGILLHFVDSTGTLRTVTSS